jgi:hypothetical protein
MVSIFSVRRPTVSFVLEVLTVVDSVSALFLVGMLGALAAISFSMAYRALPSFREPLLSVALMRIFARPGILAIAFALLALGNGAIQPYGLSSRSQRIKLSPLRQAYWEPVYLSTCVGNRSPAST